MDHKSAVVALSALAYGTRLAAVRLLSGAGDAGLAAGEIARRLEVPQNTMSDHLRALVHAEVLTPQRQGRTILYRANRETLEHLAAYIERECVPEPSQGIPATS